MVKLHWIGVAAFLLFALFSVPSVLANEVQITQCGTYTQSDTTYLIMNSLTPAQLNGDCLLFLGNNMVVTSSGALFQSITSNGHQTSTGLRVEGENVSVSNLVIRGFGTGVRVSVSNDVHLSSILVFDSEAGFNFNTMDNSTIQDVTAAGGGTPVMTDGFVVTTSNGNRFLSNVAFQITGTYLSISGSSDNAFIGGSSSFSNAGVYMQGGRNNGFEQIYLSDVQDKALEIGAGYNHFFDGITIEHIGSHGLFMANMFNSTFSNVSMTDSEGMLLIGTRYNNYTNFTISDVNGWALDLSGTTSETFNGLDIANVNNGGVGIAVEGGVGATFNGCSVVNADDSGISLENTEDNTFNDCFLDHTDGLSLIGSSNNTFSSMSVSNSDDIFGFVGVLVLANSEENIFNQLSIVNSTWTGLRVQNSNGNTFADIMINGTNNDAVVIDGLASANSLTRLAVEGTAAGYFDVQQSSARDTRFIDSAIGKYLVVDSNFSFVKNGTGQIRMIDLVSAQGASLSDVFQFSSNLLTFEGNESFSNKSAEVTLYGLPTGRINHAILRNGVVCDTSICTAVSIDGATAVFLVNEAGNYSIRSEDAPAPSTNSGGGGGGGGSGSRGTVTRTNNTVTPLSNTNSTPSTNNTIDGDVALTGNAAGQGLGKKSLWVIVIVVVALAIASAAVFYVRKMKANGANVAPHMKN